MHPHFVEVETDFEVDTDDESYTLRAVGVYDTVCQNVPWYPSVFDIDENGQRIPVPDHIKEFLDPSDAEIAIMNDMNPNLSEADPDEPTHY